ncbi:IS1380 family transposase, partial [bacterium]
MTNCKRQQELFQGFSRRKIEVSFAGGDVTSDGGILILRKVDKLLRLTERASRFLVDPRRRKSCIHEALDMLRQRVYG